MGLLHHPPQGVIGSLGQFQRLFLRDQRTDGINPGVALPNAGKERFHDLAGRTLPCAQLAGQQSGWCKYYFV